MIILWEFIFVVFSILKFPGARYPMEEWKILMGISIWDVVILEIPLDLSEALHKRIVFGI